MPNGKPGDESLTDMIVHGLHPFPAAIECLLREVLSLDPKFADGRRPYLQQVEWLGMFSDWQKGTRVEEGCEALRRVLADLRK